MPEVEEEAQEIENLFEKIVKENFPNLGEVQEAQNPKVGPRKHTPRHIVITLAKIKEKERILETAREKYMVTYK